MRASEIAQLLAADAENVARHLLPNGRREGREWVVGDIDGSAGDSLKLCIAGSKAGVWKDFATDEGGDFIGLWMAARAIGLREACSEGMRYLGIKEEPLQPPKKAYAKPSREDVQSMREPLATWFRTVRKVSDAALSAFKVAQKKGVIMFPYLRDGELIFAKYRKEPGKTFWIDKDCEPCLFGWQAMPANVRTVTLCEGEIDALSFWDYGIPALSVPMGGGKDGKQTPWIETEFERLAVFDEIFLCLDADKTGEAGMQEIAKRLGRERCRVVRLPRKDANQCAQDGIAREVIEECFANAATLDPERLRDAYDFTDAVLREFEVSENGEAGIRLPWAKVNDQLILRYGEVSVWAGINGHGKSEVAGMITLDAVIHETRACCASLEFRPEKWLKRMVRQACASQYPTKPHIRNVMQALRNSLWVYNCSGTAKTTEMLEVFQYAAKRYAVKLFLVDNLAKCGIAEDDYSGQKGFIDALTDFARDFGTHVIIVAHTKKTDTGENKPPEKHDIKGTGAITDMVDTVVQVWRNKPKERAIAMRDEDASQRMRTDPDCLLICSKQRNGEHEPRIGLWFDRVSHQYLELQDQVARPMLGLQAVAEDYGA